MKINKILVPIDFSVCSINALKIATGLAKGQGASLQIINAVHVPAHLYGDVIPTGNITNSILSEYEAEVESNFKGLTKKVPQLNDILYTTEKSISVTADAINDCLENGDIDLIVMGTKGSHDTLDKLIGSISSEVINFSKIPVLIIPENAHSLKIKTIGFAADLGQIQDIKKLKFLALLAELANAEIKIFHVSQKDDKEHLTENEQEKMKLLDAFSNVKHSYVWMDEEELLDGIFDFINSHQLDMLAMYPRHHGFWEKIFKPSLTKKIVLKIQIPLLTIHE